MDEKTLRALINAGAVKRIHIIAMGAKFHVEADTPNGSITVSTLKGGLKNWVTLDAAAKWIHSLGMGKAQVDITKWQPKQRGFKI